MNPKSQFLIFFLEMVYILVIALAYCFEIFRFVSCPVIIKCFCTAPRRSVFSVIFVIIRIIFDKCPVFMSIKIQRWKLRKTQVHGTWISWCQWVCFFIIDSPCSNTILAWVVRKLAKFAVFAPFCRIFTTAKIFSARGLAAMGMFTFWDSNQ